MTTTPSTTSLSTPLTPADLLDGWGRLWSGDLALAPSLVTDDVTVRFGNPALAADGDAVRGPERSPPSSAPPTGVPAASGP